MKLTRLLLATGVASVALGGTALADSVIDLKEGIGRIVNDDPGVASQLTIETSSDRVLFTEPVDPQGMQGGTEDGCQQTQFNGTVATQISCPKSGLRTGIVVEIGPDEDTVVYKVTDVPLSVAGGPGADKVTSSDAADDLGGDQGNDSLTSGAGDDIVDGGDGSDTLDSGVGNDQLTGGSGTDTFAAGAGDDKVSAADGVIEQIDCGEGTDTVIADGDDKLANCENITLQNVAPAAPEDPATVNDETAPKLDIGGSLDQRVGKGVAFVATCSEKGVVNAVGFVDVGGINSAMKPTEKKVDVDGGGVRLRLALSKSQIRNIRKDLRKRRKPRVRVTISCVDTAGNTSPARKFWIRLRK